MTLDLVIRNARLSDGGAPVDLGICQGRIATIGHGLSSDARVLDAQGGRLIRGFVDSHLHLDKACLLDRAANPTGTLKGAIEAVSAAKRDFTTEDVYARGARVLEKAIGQGTNLVRAQTEIDPVVGLAGFQAVRQLKADYAWALDLQICVFPQEGLRSAGGLPLYRHRSERSDRTAVRHGAALRCRPRLPS